MSSVEAVSAVLPVDLMGGATEASPAMQQLGDQFNQMMNANAAKRPDRPNYDGVQEMDPKLKSITGAMEEYDIKARKLGQDFDTFNMNSSHMTMEEITSFNISMMFRTAELHNEHQVITASAQSAHKSFDSLLKNQ